MAEGPARSLTDWFLGKLDLPFNNFGQRNVRSPHARQSIDQGSPSGVQLLDPLGNHIDENLRIGDEICCLLYEITFHGSTGKSRYRLWLLEGNYVVSLHQHGLVRKMGRSRFLPQDGARTTVQDFNQEILRGYPQLPP